MKKKNVWPVIILSMVNLLFLPVLVQAVPTVDFSVELPHPATARISYAGGNAPLIGTDISVTRVIGLDTPLNNLFSRPVIGGLLSFVTGEFAGSTSSTWNFGAGGNIFITGGVDLNNSGSIDVGEPDGYLLFGVFNSANILRVGDTFKIAGASFWDVKDPLLTAFYGLAADVIYNGNFNLSFAAAGSPPNAFTSTQVFSGNVTNSLVPEPTTVLLLGLGLIGIAAYTKMRLKNTEG